MINMGVFRLEIFSGGIACCFVLRLVLCSISRHFHTEKLVKEHEPCGFSLNCFGAQGFDI